MAAGGLRTGTPCVDMLAGVDDDAFLRQFETLTLPFDQWTHRAHVRVGYLYVVGHGFEHALVLVRRGIQAYNRHNQVPEGPDRGYHETLTHALLHLIDVTVKEHGPAASSNAFFDDHPELHKKQVLRLFYSRGRMMSAEAKATFVEPDLAPLPRSVG